MKILVTGAGGMVGSELVKRIPASELIIPARHELNVGNLEQVLGFQGQDPDFIIHLASETDHEYCEVNPSQCYFTNTVGTGNMVKLAKLMQIPIFYLSTASVYDGEQKTPYGPYNEPNPINHYNTSKFYGEIIVRRYMYGFVLRAGWMFGGGPNVDKKFVNKIMQKVNRGFKRISVADDCIGSPTYSKDLGEFIYHCITNFDDFAGSGYINCANETQGGVSRYDFALEIVKILQLDVEIKPVKIDDLKFEFPCPRTNYEVLEDNPLMRNWKDALREYLYAYYKH